MTSMRILLVHNRYRVPGGEDEVFERERRLLESRGNAVVVYERDNAEIEKYGLWQKFGIAPRTIWNWESKQELRKVLERERPEVAHFHNTFPLISPAAYAACREAGVPVVQTLHNPRLLCPAATFYRDGHLCEDCLGTRVRAPAVIHACYRESRVQTAVVASMLSLHQWKGTWQKEVDLYITATEFYRKKFIQGGLPPTKLFVKPHFVSPDPGLKMGAGEYALFVGRLSPEKGIYTLMRAWTQLKGIPLRIRGDGPLLGWVRQQTQSGNSQAELVGRLSGEEMVSLLKGARFLVWPSEGFYEVFGLVAVEAFACGVPVIASRIGAMAEIVDDSRTGMCFTPGDPSDLAAKVEWAWNHPQEMEAMSRAARAEFRAKYTEERNYKLLIDAYAKAGSAGAKQEGIASAAIDIERGAPTPSDRALAEPGFFSSPSEAAGGVHILHRGDANGRLTQLSEVEAPGREGENPPGAQASELVRAVGGAVEREASHRDGGIRKVVVVHNFYQQGGGEDVVFEAEKRLLRSHGHEVVEYCEDNHRIEEMNRLALGARTIWSRRTERQLASLLREEKPGIVHFHNTFPLVSPAAYYACRDAGVPVVQTLHNYRILCAGGNLHRDSHICEDCVGRTFGWPGILHGCYRQSRAASSVVAAMVATHWALGTWRDLVGAYIALTKFSRQKFIQGGLPAEKLVVKPNFADVDCGPKAYPGDYALYLGRLSPEKGVALLVGAWRRLASSIPLRVVGDGPLRQQLEREFGNHMSGSVNLLGRLARGAALEWLRGARFLIVPSEWYEAFPLVVVEAFASGTPVIGAKLGALEEVVEDGRTGLHFVPGNSEDLSLKVKWAWEHPEEMASMGRTARAEYEAKYTADRNYKMLIDCYSAVLEKSAHAPVE